MKLVYGVASSQEFDLERGVDVIRVSIATVNADDDGTMYRVDDIFDRKEHMISFRQYDTAKSLADKLRELADKVESAV